MNPIILNVIALALSGIATGIQLVTKKYVWAMVNLSLAILNALVIIYKLK